MGLEIVFSSRTHLNSLAIWATVKDGMSRSRLSLLGACIAAGLLLVFLLFRNDIVRHSHLISQGNAIVTGDRNCTRSSTEVSPSNLERYRADGQCERSSSTMNTRVMRISSGLARNLENRRFMTVRVSSGANPSRLPWFYKKGPQFTPSSFACDA